jgi:hypothetical protein
MVKGLSYSRMAINIKAITATANPKVKAPTNGKTAPFTKAN